MSKHLELLESAISDVGYWRWWSAKLPATFQVEFGGAQLWAPPTKPDGPPSGVVALRFTDPSVVAFLQEPGAKKLPRDWRQALHEDRIEHFPVTRDDFTLRSEEAYGQLLKACRTEYLAGGPGTAPVEGEQALLAFRAGPVGLAVRAKKMSVMTHSGELSAEQISESSQAWWKYWREYWRRKDSDSPMPKDYACEVTIPSKEE